MCVCVCVCVCVHACVCRDACVGVWVHKFTHSKNKCVRHRHVNVVYGCTGNETNDCHSGSHRAETECMGRESVQERLIYVH